SIVADTAGGAAVRSAIATGSSTTRRFGESRVISNLSSDGEHRGSAIIALAVDRSRPAGSGQVIGSGLDQVDDRRGVDRPLISGAHVPERGRSAVLNDQGVGGPGAVRLFQLALH